MLTINTIYQGDCLELMPEIEKNSVDLIVTDPPYFKVKDEAWDQQWKDADIFIEWLGKCIEQWHRILKPNGSLYVFADTRMAARVEMRIGKIFNVLNHIVWRKNFLWKHSISGAHRANKEELRCFNPETERIIFAEHFGADNIAKGEAGYATKCDELRGFVFEPLRAYLDGERKRAEINKADCNAACGFSRSAGGMASRHYFSRSQWCLPTVEHYKSLQELFNKDGGEYLRREYEELRREYEELRREYEELRRPFHLSRDVNYTDLWDFPAVTYYKGKHPCEKPVALIEHIIKASSRAGALILDCFFGSGSTAIAALSAGRNFIGIELSKDYCEIARRWIERETRQQRLSI